MDASAPERRSVTDSGGSARVAGMGKWTPDLKRRKTSDEKLNGDNMLTAATNGSDGTASPVNGRAEFNVLAAPNCEDMARRMCDAWPGRFRQFDIKWRKFADSQMDNIHVGGFHPKNYMRDARVVFLANFDSNDSILSQFHVLIMLLESFIAELTVVLPFFPTGTMERINQEGEVATANTISRLFSCLPTAGRPTRVMIYDIHTLQNRFYLHTNALASLHTAIPILLREIGPCGVKIDAIAFPDEGAAKRFKGAFNDFPLIVCGKVRDGDRRKVTIHEGDPQQQRVLIVDDMVRSGGTLHECANELKQRGSTAVSAFCTHAGFKKDGWRKFTADGEWDVFENFWTTNSVPSNTDQMEGISPFKILDLMPSIVEDLCDWD